MCENKNFRNFILATHVQMGVTSQWPSQLSNRKLNECKYSLMALYCYCKKQAPEGPSPNGHLSNSLLPATIRRSQIKLPRSQGTYVKFTPETQTAIAKLAFLHENKAAIRHFAKELGKEIDSSVITWKKKYSAELKRVMSERDSEKPGEEQIKGLPTRQIERKDPCYLVKSWTQQSRIISRLFVMPVESSTLHHNCSCHCYCLQN